MIVTKIRLLAALLMLFVLGLSASAQDDAEISVADDLQVTVVQTAESGSLTAEEGDTYTLTLVGVGEAVPSLVEQPTRSVGNYIAQDFADDWAAGEALLEASLVAEGQLVFSREEEEDILTLSFELSNPAYTPADAPENEMGSAAFTYTAELVEIASSDPDAKLDFPPEAFETATLFMVLDATFAEGIASGRVQRLGSARPTGTPDDPPFP